MHILFMDWIGAGEPYDQTTLEQSALGGTEATLIRVATALASHHRIYVALINRCSEQVTADVQFGGPQMLDHLAQSGKLDIVVVLRKPKHALKAAKLFPNAALVLWAHDYLSMKNRLFTRRLRAVNCSVVAVSQTHAGHTAALLGNGWLNAYKRKPPYPHATWPVTCIPNPIDEALQTNQTAIDRNKLIFYSSPHKGLGQVLDQFQHIHQQLPSLQLNIANPGYRALTGGKFVAPEKLNHPAVRILGSLSRDALMHEVRSSLCVFYPQTAHPETFGLIYAEANAVGTPVLAHDFGAAPEVLSAEQLIDGRDQDKVYRRLCEWHGGDRPSVQLPNRYRLPEVVDRWNALFERIKWQRSQ